MTATEEMRKEIRLAVEDAFSAQVLDKRYIDVSRIPLICQSIISIDKKLDNLVSQDQFWPVKTIVYSMTGIILTGVIAALIALILK